ncbi:MAG: hypothetical protein L3J89_13615 [Gammaproteobacteria bacterium]|nr:hypothetical protein [Gammaproteobacteria bacterium]
MDEKVIEVIAWLIASVIGLFFSIEKLLDYYQRGEIDIQSKGIYFTGDIALVMVLIITIVSVLFFMASLSCFKKMRKKEGNRGGE